MPHDELIRLWRSQGDGPAASGEEILMDVQMRARKFDRRILWRDLGEGLAGLLMVGLTCFVAIRADAGWPPWLGALAMTGCCVWVYAHLHITRVRHRVPRTDLPLAERLRAEIDKVGDQEALLRSVPRWYLLPLAVGGVTWLGLLGLAVPVAPEQRPWTVLLLAAAAALIMAAVGWVVTRANRFAADHHLRPLRRQLEELLAQVEAA